MAKHFVLALIFQQGYFKEIRYLDMLQNQNKSLHFMECKCVLYETRTTKLMFFSIRPRVAKPSDSRQGQLVCQGLSVKPFTINQILQEERRKVRNLRQKLFPRNYQVLYLSKCTNMWLDEISESMACETTTQGTLLTGSAE